MVEKFNLNIIGTYLFRSFVVRLEIDDNENDLLLQHEQSPFCLNVATKA